MAVSARSPTWTGSIMVAISDTCWRYSISAQTMHLIGMNTVKNLLSVYGHHISCMIQVLHLSSVLSRLSYVTLMNALLAYSHIKTSYVIFVSLCHPLVCVVFSVLDAGSWRGAPLALQHCDMYGTGAVSYD